MISKLGGVENKIEVGDYEGAVNKFQNDIMDKFLKWVSDPIAQQELLAIAESALECMLES